MRDLSKTLAPIVEALGAELIDIERVKEHGSLFLRVTVDTPEGADLNACEKVHKRIAPLLEEVEYDYLEVASPGLDRPLKRPDDYVRYAGERVEVRLYKPQNGKKVFFGTLLGRDEDDAVRIAPDEGGEPLCWPRKELALVKLVAEIEPDKMEGHT